MYSRREEFLALLMEIRKGGFIEKDVTVLTIEGWCREF
jgi:hypothetical protein